MIGRPKWYCENKNDKKIIKYEKVLAIFKTTETLKLSKDWTD